MRFGRRNHGLRMLAVDVAPMIDVVFLLIIFFMTTARFAQDTRAQLDLPRERGEQHEVADEAGLIINIDAQGAIIVGRDTIDLDGLQRIVQAEVGRLPGQDAGQLKLLLRADRNVDSSRLNEVVQRLQKIGVGAARVATEVP